MLGLDPSIQGIGSIAGAGPLGSSPRGTKKETRVTRREAVRVAVPSAAVLVVQRAGVHLAVVGVDHVLRDRVAIGEEALDDALDQLVVVLAQLGEIGRASCRERVCQYV